MRIYIMKIMGKPNLCCRRMSFHSRVKAGDSIVDKNYHNPHFVVWTGEIKLIFCFPHFCHQLIVESLIEWNELFRAQAFRF